MATGAERRDLVEKLEQNRSELLELARSMTPERAESRKQEGGVSVGGLFDEAGDWDVDGLTSRMREVRETTLRFIGATADAEFERIGRNSPFGDLSVYQFLKSLYRHDRMHIDEMQGRDQTYVIKTADGRQL